MVYINCKLVIPPNWAGMVPESSFEVRILFWLSMKKRYKLKNEKGVQKNKEREGEK